MTVKGRSARGEIVDFDLLKIKEQIANAPKPTNVRAREDFIDQKFKRRLKKTTEAVAASISQVPGTLDTSPTDEDSDFVDVEPVIESGDNVAPEIPAPVTEQPATQEVTSKKIRILPQKN